MIIHKAGFLLSHGSCCRMNKVLDCYHKHNTSNKGSGPCTYPSSCGRFPDTTSPWAGDSLVSLLYLSTLSFHNRSGSHDIAEQFMTVTTTTSNLNHNTFRWGSKTRHFYYFYVCSLSVVVLLWDGWEFKYFNFALVHVFAGIILFFVLFSYLYLVEGYKWTRKF